MSAPAVLAALSVAAFAAIAAAVVARGPRSAPRRDAVVGMCLLVLCALVVSTDGGLFSLILSAACGFAAAGFLGSAWRHRGGGR